MGKICDTVQGLKPTIMMVGVQMALTGVNIFYKLAANDGMSLKVLVAYRFLFAALTVVPLALILERKRRPKLTWKIVFQAFLCALFGGSMAQNLYAEGLALTSATFVAAMANLVPAITFVLAIFFGKRLEPMEAWMEPKTSHCSLYGAVIIVLGLYTVLWGKSKEIKRISQLMPTKSFNEADQTDNNASESIKSISIDHCSNIMAVAPSFLPETEIEIFHDEEVDLEASVPNPNI
ncbi:WAT1-related protein [Forsythia ovata]|uniref:WAT1-related protein n=1 Tax=Forsythia ovata TaxID=205694 RepID=A0ABD1QNX8_9LAMI